MIKRSELEFAAKAGDSQAVKVTKLSFLSHLAVILQV